MFKLKRIMKIISLTFRILIVIISLKIFKNQFKRLKNDIQNTDIPENELIELIKEFY